MDKLINRILSIEKGAEMEMERTMKDLERERKENDKECDEIKAGYTEKLNAEIKKIEEKHSRELEECRNRISEEEKEITDRLNSVKEKNIEKWVKDAVNKIIG